jgi:hypothetical protein
MNRASRRSEAPANLSQSVRQRLKMYSLASSAAGVSLLALAQPGEAKVVYTKVHQVIGTNGVYELDLNHDGIGDFLILESGNPSSRSTTQIRNELFAKEALGNAVEGSIASSRHLASALKRGAWIGPRQRFISKGYNGEAMANVFRSDLSATTYGRWVNVNNRYLGLRFRIDGKTHYGWARLTVHLQGDSITAVLTGYAYETVPNKNIRAGQTTDQRDDSTIGAGSADSDSSGPAAAEFEPSSNPLNPASLGKLALGAQGVPSMRRP